ncbi:chromosome segregation protein SMC [soil metagenome]
MRLSALRLQGFKSFADRTSLEFREGVTAIVGSNGCGKSNVADAIRWVLGEQRASALRGARMDEVIFGGSLRRRPLNLAEVSLLFSNEEGRVPIPQAEIEVARKVFREGGSEYLLNRSSCRLRDIQHLLRDTGLGANAYATIEAGMIETLLSDRAEERRMLFEEAAGVGRYKDSLRAAGRRLDAAEADLARLGDLVAEVESKVRSLARQRRRAQRHQELQDRRLELEIALARSELATLEKVLAEGAERLARLAEEESRARADREEAEALGEARRAEAAQLAGRRTTVAGRLEEVRRQLDEREREVLLAGERRSHAEMRLQQLVRERSELAKRASSLSAEAERLTETRRRAAETLRSLQERREAGAEENEKLRSALTAHRQASEDAASRTRELAREIATAEGERTAAERRRREAEERLPRLEEREREIAAQLEALSAQGTLWGAQAEELRARLTAASSAAQTAKEEIRALREQEAQARTALRAAEDRLARLASQLSAREALEASYEGFAPAARALLAARGRFPGVHGPLADFIAPAEGGAEEVRAIERYLGPLLQAVVVEDLATARAVRRWFREEWKGGGSLLLLPGPPSPGPSPAVVRCDSSARGEGSTAEPATTEEPRLGRIEFPLSQHWERGLGGEGAAWVRLLLADLQVGADGDPLEEHHPGTARVGPGGEVVDARGVIRLGEQGTGTGEGILTRREALQRLREERDAAAAERDARAAQRDALAASLTAAEERAREADDQSRSLGTELQRLEAEAAGGSQRLARLREDRDETSRTLTSLRQNVAEAAARIVTLDARLAELRQAAEMAGTQAEEARCRLAELEAQWEAVREEEAELRVALARAEGELRDAERRTAAAEQGGVSARGRTTAIDAEAAELRASLEGLSGVRERAATEVERLTIERDRQAAELQQIEANLAAAEREITRTRTQAGAVRTREAELAEERHRLDLAGAELRSRSERLRERLEAEWGRPWEALLAQARPIAEGEPQMWSEELQSCSVQLESLGPVNMLAVEEHAEEERRLTFLLEQQLDLTKARDDLAAASREINRTAREIFLSTFATIRENFQRTFHSLFQGGECDIWLAEPDDPLESAVEIQASPRGKRTQRIHLLSGGERTLTALALLFALYLVKPSPFCVLDEVDAPLDESNVGRFIQLLHDFKAETQFIVITHNPRTMEAADWIYGVTMQEPGVSSIVGVEMQDAWVREGRVA